MATTSPDSIQTPDPSSPYNLVSDLATMANSVQTALNRRANFYVGTSAQRIAFTDAPDGVHWQDSNGDRREWVRVSGVWRGASPLGGEVSIVSTGGTASTEVVTFPAGYFATPPLVMVTLQNPISTNVTLGYGCSARSTTEATIFASRSSTTAVNLIWAAFPMV